MLAVEGSTLTFLGLLKYDIDSEEVILAEPIAFVGGGFQTMKDHLIQQFNQKVSNAKCYWALTGAFFSVGIAMVIVRMLHKIRQKKIEQAR